MHGTNEANTVETVFEDHELAEKQAAAVEKQIHEGGEIGDVDEKHMATQSERAI